MIPMPCDRQDRPESCQTDATSVTAARNGIFSVTCLQRRWRLQFAKDIR
nr:MAG TPA: hypothetical protein [Caudoviricetes sp.]